MSQAPEPSYLHIGSALLLVLANGFFVATEFAIVKIRPSWLKAQADDGHVGAASALVMVRRLDSFLSATQFGITLTSLGLGWLGEPAFARVMYPVARAILWPAELLGWRAPDAANVVSHGLASALAFALITVLHIVVGELAPKSLAIQRAESVTLAVAWPMKIFHAIFYPGIWLLNGMAGRLLKWFGLHRATESEDAHSEEELRLILTSSAAAGAITTSRAEVLERALEMMHKTVRQVLVPRSQVHFLDLDEPLEKNISQARAGGHTWLPVVRGTLDQVEGVVNVKDLFFLLSKGELKSLGQVQRPVLFVPENATLEQLLSEFRRRRRQMAVVVDEHGGTSGIVSLADVVAEVVGDVAELGRPGQEVKTLPGGRLELPGTAELSDLEDRLDVTFDVEDGEVTTIAGYLMAKLGRVPEKGDKVQIGEFEVFVEEVEGPRVSRVRISPRAAT